MRKATETEKTAYLATDPKPVYGLHAWITIDGHKCAVEDLRCWGRGDPQWEIVMPDGYRHPDGTHTVLCYTLAEVRTYARDRLVKCEPGDYCGCEAAATH